jgi:hypothetical protein
VILRSSNHAVMLAPLSRHKVSKSRLKSVKYEPAMKRSYNGRSSPVRYAYGVMNPL